MLTALTIIKVETDKEGILSTTNLFPGIIQDFTFIFHYEPIFELFSEDQIADHNPGTLNSTHLVITTLTMLNQSITPGDDL